jgi:hypothetical protein
VNGPSPFENGTRFFKRRAIWKCSHRLKGGIRLTQFNEKLHEIALSAPTLKGFSRLAIHLHSTSRVFI